MGDKMTLKKPSEIDLELDRLQADLDRCGRDWQAHEARVQAIKEKMTAARVKGLIEEKVFQQRSWRLRFWYDGTFRLEAYLTLTPGIGSITLLRTKVTTGGSRSPCRAG